jgi:mono/diheme cytochrome c family protein
VIAYLKSDARLVAPSDEQQPPIQPTLLGKILMNLAVKPLTYPNEPISAPPTSDQVAHGKYMSTAVIHCYHCHSAGYELVNDLSPEASQGFMGGGTPAENMVEHGEKVLSSNITPHPEYGIGNWTADQFAKAVRYGQSADGQSLSPAMPRFTNMSEEDAKAIFAYLQTIPALENDIQALASIMQ